MKASSLILGTMIFFAACNTQPQAGNSPSDSTKLNADTTGLAEFQTTKAQNELGIQNKKESSPNTVTKTTAHSNQTSTNSSTSSTGTTQKKGWSKTAKGAVIGGVVGAGTGAVVNKKNRAAGAVIGGIIGAGTGAVIGNQMDKKDGRH